MFKKDDNLPEIIPRHWFILGPSTFTGYNGFSLKITKEII